VAEIVAAQRALSQVASTCPLQIFTDSKYVVKSMSEWRIKWKLSGWSKPLENRTLLKALSDACDERLAPTTFHYIKAHAGLYGNTQADKLANAGARLDVLS
jgi:ribonuclease HI